MQVPSMKNLNVALAIGLHCLVGGAFVFAASFADFGDAQTGLAVLLWFGGLFLILDGREKSPGGVWLVPLLWPFTAWFLALGVLVFVGGLVWLAIQSRAPATPPAAADRHPSAYETKLRAVESTLVTLETQLRDLIGAQPPAPAVAVPAAAPPAPAAPTTVPAPSPTPRRPSFDRALDWSDLLGARALAWAGGVVTVLGILFFFVLAANRGWLLPEIRVAFGATTSFALFAAGFWVKQRFGSLYAAVSAAGAGIAGAYATLLAATALYDFVPESWALVAAAAIAAAGAATALAWSSQTVAGLGLIGAILVPLMAFVQDGELSFVGTSFAALMLVGTAAVALRAGWPDLVLLAGGASLVQIAGLTAQAEGSAWGVFWLASTFWLLYLGIGLAWQLVRGDGGLDPVAGVFVITGGALATYASLFLLDESAGYGLLAVAGFYGLLAAGFLRLAPYRDLASVLGAVSVVVAAIAAGVLLSGTSLTFVWCAVAILLAWLARAARENRLLLPALAYAALGAGYALAVEAQPRDLFLETAHAGSGALSVVAAGVALALFALFAGMQTRGVVSGTRFGRALDLAVRFVSEQTRVYLWTAGALFLYAASLGVLALFVRVADFDWGHTALAGLWAAVGLGLVATGVRVGRGLDTGGLALLSITAVEVVVFDSTTLQHEAWGTSFLLTAAAGALAGFEYGRLSKFRLRLIPAGCAAVVSALLAAGGIQILTDGDWHRISSQGGALVLAALAYGAIAVPVFRSHRDLSTIYWALALTIATTALTLLVADFWLVLAGGIAAAALALLGRVTTEPRLELAGAAAFALTGVFTLASQAPPEDLFEATTHPAGGAPSVLILVAAAIAGAFVLTWRPLRRGAAWTAAALTLYAASLGILELFVEAADFGWGHVALAGFWGAVALAVLEVGLRRDRLEVQIAAGALLAFAALELAYDWDELGYTKAAIASLAVAAAALAAGIEYGRLARLRERLAPAGVALATSAGLTALALVTLGGGTWHRIDVVGGLFVLAGAVYAGLGAALLRKERDLATCLWAFGLAFAAAGAALLVDGFWLVLAGSLAAAALHVLGEAAREQRLQIGSAAVYVLALGYALAIEAPPRDFFVESAHPGSGVPALLVLAGSGAVFAWRPGSFRHAKLIALGVAGALSFYAVSLGLLELAEIATDADIGTKFQRGHTAVTIFWGLVSLGFLYAGLKRRSWQLRAAGFALFGVSLAKLFLYDLAFLSPLTRALSFVAVGAVLLFAGFFYQRLSEQLEGRGGARPTP
jgi:uncharacterized membrane protein